MPGKAGPEIGFGSLFDATSDAPCLCLPCRSPPTHTRQAATAQRATCKVASAGHTSTRRCSLRSSAFRTSGREFPRSSCCVPFTDVFCRYEDFAECFDLWCKETEGASGLCNTLSIHMEHLNIVRSHILCFRPLIIFIASDKMRRNPRAVQCKREH